MTGANVSAGRSVQPSEAKTSEGRQEKLYEAGPSDPQKCQEEPSEAPQSQRVNPLKPQEETKDRRQGRGLTAQREADPPVSWLSCPARRRPSEVIASCRVSERA